MKKAYVKPEITVLQVGCSRMIVASKSDFLQWNPDGENSGNLPTVIEGEDDKFDPDNIG